MGTIELRNAPDLLAVLFFLAAASPVVAQTTNAPVSTATPAAASDTPDAIAADKEGDIVVTAQRREQRLQDVPIAITALTGAQVESQGITSTQSLGQAVPGLTFTESSGFVQPFIRGIGSTVTNLGEQGTAAVYIDGVYMPSITGQIYQLANIQSVEVLKGPQGTLFGRNANSGAIIITTRAPSFTPEGRFQIGYGSFDAVTAQGFVAAPLGGDIAVSIAGNYDRHDGWFTDRGGPTIGDSERWGIRGAVLINATPNLSITFNGDVLRSDAPGTILAQPVGGYQGFVPGGLLPVDAYDFIGDSRNVGFVADQDGVSARLRWEVGPVELISTTAHRWFRSMSTRFDSDSTPLLFAQISQTERGRALTQEVQLNSTGKGPFTWVVGGFYMRQSAAYAPLRIVSPAGTTLITAQQVTKAYAGFVDASYDLGDLEITGGLRYSREPKEYDGQANGTVIFNNVGKTWNALTPRAVPSYHSRRTLLAYASGLPTSGTSGIACARIRNSSSTVA